MFPSGKNLSGLTIILAFAVALSTSFSLHLNMASHAQSSSAALTSGVYNLPYQGNENYWTRERLRTIPPIESISKPLRSLRNLTTPSSSEPQVSKMAPKRALADGTKGEPVLPPGSSLSFQDLPLVTTGKIIMRFPGGLTANCSGAVATSTNGAVVTTASHCLFIEGKAAIEVIFCPRYKDGDCPLGIWFAKAIVISPAYKRDEDKGPDIFAKSDVGMLVLHRKKGRTIVETIGGNGWVYNGESFTNEKPFGYPSNIKKGQFMVTCTTKKARPTGDPDLMQINGCQMGQGSSGGPWFTLIDGRFYINGHNDVGPEDNSFIASPIYTDKWFELFDIAQKFPI